MQSVMAGQEVSFTRDAAHLGGFAACAHPISSVCESSHLGNQSIPWQACHSEQYACILPVLQPWSQPLEIPSLPLCAAVQLLNGAGTGATSWSHVCMLQQVPLAACPHSMLFHALLCPFQHLALNCTSEVLCPELLAKSCPWYSACAPLVGWSQPAAKHPHSLPVSVAGAKLEEQSKKTHGSRQRQFDRRRKEKKKASEAKAITHHVLQAARRSARLHAKATLEDNNPCEVVPWCAWKLQIPEKFPANYSIWMWPVAKYTAFLKGCQNFSGLVATRKHKKRNRFFWPVMLTALSLGGCDRHRDVGFLKESNWMRVFFFSFSFSWKSHAHLFKWTMIWAFPFHFRRNVELWLLKKTHFLQHKALFCSWRYL